MLCGSLTILFRRENFQVGIIYIQKGQSDAEIFENQGGSPEYQAFLQNVGWMVPFHINVDTIRYDMM